MLNVKAIITTGMVLCIALTGLAGAAIYDWTGAAADGNWNTPGNWLVTGSTYTWPQEQWGNEYTNEDADEINLTNGDTVSRSPGLSPDGARDKSNVCKLTLDNGTTLTVDGTIWVADYTNTQGRLDVLGGSFLGVAGQIKLGDDPGSIGTMNVVDSRIDIGSNLIVTNRGGGTGYLNISGNSLIDVGGNFYMNDGSGAGSTSYTVMDAGTVNVAGYCTFNDDTEGTATFILNGGSFNVAGTYLNLSDNLDGHAYLTINAGEMITGGSIMLGKDGGTGDIGEVRIYMNGGLLQGENLEFIITDSKIIFSDGLGKLKINSAAVSEAGMQGFIDSGNIDVSALVDYTISTEDGYTVLTPVPGVAGIVAPLAGASGVAVDTILEWLSPEAYAQSGFRVYFGTDPNEQSPWWYGNNEIVSGDNVNSVDPAPAGDLENLTTYYWRVDALEPNTLGTGFIVHEGMRWNFTTISAFPTVETQPIYQSVVAGESAEFMVVASNTESYQWFQSQDAANDTSADDVAVGTDSATLSLANVQVPDEGYYFCEASNSAGSDKSAVAKLIVERLIHHYPLDNESAADAVGVVDGTVVGDPNWIDGIAGGAIDIFPASMSEFEDYIVLGSPGDISYGAYDFTVSFWMKTPAGFSGDPALMSNKDWDSGSNVGWVIAWGGSGDGIYQWNLDAGASGRFDFDPTGPETADNQWHLVTVAHDREGMATFYIDGEVRGEVDISAHAGSSLDAGFPTVIGNDGMQNYHDKWNEYTRCAFDDVRIYNYALDSVEVATLYTDIVEGAWRCANRPLYDFSGDCVVGLADIAFLVTDWLDCGWAPSAGCL